MIGIGTTILVVGALGIAQPVFLRWPAWPQPSSSSAVRLLLPQRVGLYRAVTAG